MISMEEALDRYAALRETESVVGTVQEIAKAAGTTRQLLRYYYNKRLKKSPERSEQHRGGLSTPCDQGATDSAILAQGATPSATAEAS